MESAKTATERDLPLDPARMRRRAWGEVFLGAGTVITLLLVLIAIDPRVREQVSMRVLSRPSVEIAAAGARVHDLTSVLVEVARDQSATHAPLLIFALAATVLTLFMLRT
jgi:hypothetical protein